jgi:hypothetical protein
VKRRSYLRFTRLVATGAGLVAGAYATYVGVAWYRYGKAARPSHDDRDVLLDCFMPEFDVVERHQVAVAAPAALTLEIARDIDLLGLPAVRAIVKARELVLGGRPDATHRPHGLLAEMLSLGWVVLAEIPGCEIVVGAVTRPWEPDVTFRSVPPDNFAAFNESGYVKIAWTLRADAASPTQSTFRTETRAIATDSIARARFRRYWSLFSPGIWLIRRMLLNPVKSSAERRCRAIAS